MRIIMVDVIIMFIRVELLCRKISQIDHRPIVAYTILNMILFHFYQQKITIQIRNP